MKNRDIQAFSDGELASRLGELEQGYLGSAQAVRSGQEKNVRTVRALRRDIARLKTETRRRVKA